MNFDLDADDLALQGAIRDVCRGVFPLERVRAMTAIDRAAWRALGDAGVFSLSVSEEHGGAGLGMTQGVLVFEELGRALVPGPLVASFLAADMVEGVATGERIAGIVEESAGRYVEHLSSLDEVVWLTPTAVFRLPAGNLKAELVEKPLDPLTPRFRVTQMASWEGVEDDPAMLRLRGALLTAALSLGIASASTEMATAYAKERMQFGRVIGSFQAVKHILADMLVRAEVARAAVYAAGCMMDSASTRETYNAVATAKILASEAAIANGKASIQVHGGMGFTWEVDAHLFVKRAVVLASQFGTPDEYAVATSGSLVGI